MKDIKINHEIDSFKLDVSHKELLFIREALGRIDTSIYSLDKINDMVYDCDEFKDMGEVNKLIKKMLKKLKVLDHIHPY